MTARRLRVVACIRWSAKNLFLIVISVLNLDKVVGKIEYAIALEIFNQLKGTLLKI